MPELRGSAGGGLAAEGAAAEGAGGRNEGRNVQYPDMGPIGSRR